MGRVSEAGSEGGNNCVILIRYRAGRRAASSPPSWSCRSSPEGSRSARVPAIKTITPRSDSRSRTSTSCASRSGTTTATRSARGSSRPTATTPRRPLASPTGPGSSGSRLAAPRARRQKAIMLDVDDTTLATWNYEIFSNWAFNPTTNGHVRDRAAVPGRVRAWSTWSQDGRAEGYAIIFLTGRPRRPGGGDARQPDRRRGRRGRRLPDADHALDGEDGLFTKPAVADYPDYLQAACAGDPERRPARRSTTSRRRARTSSRSATTSWPTSATSSATSRAASPTARSSSRTRTTSCRSRTESRVRVRPSGRVLAADPR